MRTEKSRDICINFDEVIKLIGSDNNHLKEFCEAGIISFTDFKKEYKQHLLNQDLKSLHKSGHRIKPVAQLLGLQTIINYYEKDKQILTDDKSDEKLKKSVQKMENRCDKIIDAFKNKKESL